MANTRTNAIDNLSQTTRLKMANLGGRLRAARKRRGWSCQRCADLAGVSTTTLKGIERGEPNVGFGFYIAVLQAFGMVTELDGLCLTCKDQLTEGNEQLSQRVTFDDDL